MSKKDLVSVIMPNYNRAKYISEAIESVISQTYPIWELIIIDDCSTDNSVNIIEEYVAKDERIKLIRLPKNSGPAIARNRNSKLTLILEAAKMNINIREIL